MEQITISIPDMTAEEAMNLIGTGDQNLNIISDRFEKKILFRNNQFIVKDTDRTTAEEIRSILLSLYRIAKKNKQVSEQDVIYACRMSERKAAADFDQLSSVIIGRTSGGRAVSPKTAGQLEFVQLLEKCDIIFSIGPAGTGKTFLAVVSAVSALKNGDVKRIVLTRPAVEAGESLGFLPGDLKEKADPYLTPLYDALNEMLGAEQTGRLIEKGTIEIAPLAYMRGRTLDDAFVILDEAQNTTGAQMKMFLTRLGFRSKMVLTGDVTQIDLKQGIISGLVQAPEILSGIPEIGIVRLTADDVVRHPLVQKIIERYADRH